MSSRRSFLAQLGRLAAAAPPVFAGGSGLLLSALTGSSVARASTTPPLPNHPDQDEIIARGWLRVALYRDFAPFSWTEGETFHGIDADLARMIAEKLGIEARFMPLTAGETVADDLRNAIWKGHYLGGGIADLMLHVPVDRRFALKNNMVVIFGPYFRQQLVLLRDVARTGETPSLAVFAFEPVGVELDSLPDFYLSGTMGGRLNPNVRRFGQVSEAVEALKAGEIAAVFAPRAALEGALHQQEPGGLPPGMALDHVVAPGLGNDRWDVGAAVSQQNRQLGYTIEDILAGLRRDGSCQALFARYGITWEDPSV